MNPEHLQIIQKAASNIAPKYTFSYMDVDDLTQEAVILGLEAYTRWDKERPLENFVSVHISNRLKNFKRDNYYRLGLEDSPEKRRRANEDKKKIMSPAPMSQDPITFESVDNEDEINYLLEALSPHLRNDFLRMANGVSINKNRRDAVTEAVREVLNEDG